MNYKDTMQVTNWICGGASMAEVERVEQYGLVDNQRFTDQAVRAFRLAWTWTGINFSEDQNRFYERRGSEALDRRIERARRIVNRFVGRDVFKAYR